MKKFTSLLGAAALTLTFATTAQAGLYDQDIYVVNFTDASSAESQMLDSQLGAALTMITNVRAEAVTIDTSTAAKWEKGAHDAFDRDIVSVFNKYVGLPGFAVVVDAKSKRTLGCVNGTFSASEIANEVNRMAMQAKGQAYKSNASTRTKTTQCPPAFNVDMGQ